MQFRETSDGLQKCANFVLIPGMLIGAVLKTSKQQNFKICYNNLFCITLLFVAESDRLNMVKLSSIEGIKSKLAIK